MATAATVIKHDGKRFEVGDTVTKSKFKDEEWDALVEAGAIQMGDEPPPSSPAKTSDMLPSTEEQPDDTASPKEDSKEAKEAREAVEEEEQERLRREGRLP